MGIFIFLGAVIIAFTGYSVSNKKKEQEGSGLPQSKDDFVIYTPDYVNEEEKNEPDIRSPG